MWKLSSHTPEHSHRRTQLKHFCLSWSTLLLACTAYMNCTLQENTDVASQRHSENSQAMPINSKQIDHNHSNSYVAITFVSKKIQYNLNLLGNV